MIKVLIVEDSSIIAMHLRVFLEEKNYEVIGRLTMGEELEGFLASNSPDVILMDVMLDGPMTGIEAVARIRNSNNQVPVIYMSALTDRVSVQAIEDIANCRKITKPFKEEELVSAIQEMVNSPMHESKM